MGNQSPKIKYDIYMETNKRFYYAGEQISGDIYLNVQQRIQFTGVSIKIQGFQFCEKKNKKINCMSSRGFNQIYLSQLVIARFPQGFKPGNYVFPFAFRLSPDLIGSCFVTKNEYYLKISYSLKVFLININQNKRSHEYQQSITIIQPNRHKKFDVHNGLTTYPKNCFFYPLGQSSLDVTLSKNQCSSGQRLKISGFIDNQNCKSDVTSTKITLINNNYITTNSVDFEQFSNVIAIETLKRIPSGTADYFQTDFAIPNTISTSFGTLCGNYYIINIKNQISGCICEFQQCPCGNYPEVNEYIYINNKNPQVEPKRIIKPPHNWNPIYFQKAVIKEVGRFNYVHNPKVNEMNREYN